MSFLRFLTLLVIGCCVSMAVAFSVTRVLMRADRVAGRDAPRAHRAALELRGEANDLFDLAERLAEHTVGQFSVPAIQPWLINVYVPELKRLRERIGLEDGLPAELVRNLEHGVELLLQAADDPTDQELRDRALSHVRMTCREVEQFIAVKGIGRLAEPRRNMD